MIFFPTYNESASCGYTIEGNQCPNEINRPLARKMINFLTIVCHECDSNLGSETFLICMETLQTTPFKTTWLEIRSNRDKNNQIACYA